jgi:hypothetical protein
MDGGGPRIYRQSVRDLLFIKGCLVYSGYVSQAVRNCCLVKAASSNVAMSARPSGTAA